MNLFGNLRYLHRIVQRVVSIQSSLVNSKSSITCVRSVSWNSRYPFVGDRKIAVAYPTSVSSVIASSADFIHVTLSEVSYLTETSLDGLVRGWRKNQVHLEANGKKTNKEKERERRGMRHVAMEFHYLAWFEEVSRVRRPTEDYIWTSKSGWLRARRSRPNTKRARKANDSQINSYPEAISFFDLWHLAVRKDF